MIKGRFATLERRMACQQSRCARADWLKNCDMVHVQSLSIAHLVHVRRNMPGY